MGKKEVRAGWYLDRDDPELERHWDGAKWTGETRPSPSLSDFLGPIEPVLMEMIGLPKDSGQLILDEVQPGHESASTSRVNRTTASN